MEADEVKRMEKAKGTAPLCIWIPGLAGTGADTGEEDAGLPFVKRLWPGLPSYVRPRGMDTDRVHVPADLPLAPQAMGAYLEDIGRLARDAARGASGISDALLAERGEQEKGRLRRELAAVSGLSSGAAQDTELEAQLARTARRVKAQQILGGFWQQQHNIAEIEALVRKVNLSSGGLRDGFGVAPEGGGDALRETAGQLGTPIAASDSSLLPNWRICLAAAIVLLPGDTVFMLEPAAAAEIADEVSFGPVPATLGLSERESCELLYAEANPAAVLGGLAGKSSWPERIRLLCTDATHGRK